MKPKNGRPEYIKKDGILFQYLPEWVYGKECYVACDYPYHYWSLAITKVKE